MGLSTTTTQFYYPFRPICPSFFNLPRSCPCASSSRPLSYALLHRLRGKLPHQAINLQSREETTILVKRNYTASPGLDGRIDSDSCAGASWKAAGETLGASRRKYAEIKCEHLQSVHSYSVTQVNSKEQAYSRNGGTHFSINKNQSAQFPFDHELKSNGKRNMAGDYVNGRAAGYEQQNGLKVKNDSKEGHLHINGLFVGETIEQRTNAEIDSCPVDSGRTNRKPAIVGGNEECIINGKPAIVNGNEEFIINGKPAIFSGNEECITSGKPAIVGGNEELIINGKPAIFSGNEECITNGKPAIVGGNEELIINGKPAIVSDNEECIINGKPAIVSDNEECITDGKPAIASDNEKCTNDKVTSRKRLVSIYKNVLVVNNVSMAEEVVRKLTGLYKNLVHACDTEVAKIDVKRETPIDHGEIICFSIYSGPEADYGNGKSCIWVDVLDGGGKDVLVAFAPFFKDKSIKKVWHNYSFDNHVIENYGFSVFGFHADTMHMARLWDSSRRTEGGYSLEALTGIKTIMERVQSCYDNLIGKVSMKTIFGKKKVKKDGSEGKLTTIAPVEEIQREERIPWICYSALDAMSTLQLYESLKSLLSKMQWQFNGKPVPGKNMFDFYQEYWRPFGELLVRMETEGMLVDRPYLADMEKVAKAEQEVAANRFRTWASKYCSDAKYMNVGSDTQLRQLLFGGTANRKDPSVTLPNSKEFKVPNVDKVIEEGKKTPNKYRNITLHDIGVKLQTEIYTATGWPSVSGDALKTLAGKVSAECDFMNDVPDEQPDDVIMDDTEAADIAEIKESSTFEDVDTSAYGTALRDFKKVNREEEGIEACHAIAALCEVCCIDSLISNFILPLQGSHISGKTGRIHCSLNINTETGRLSARRPNLQNQPALEKDRYKIRRAFVAPPGNSLIVADYGQLELRILAHLADCKSMLDAFKAGGDFHSRTAMNMYPHIREAVEKKHVLLEWYPQPGEDKPPVPLLKDAFGSERRKAKMLNFSIAYGKTPVGLAQDWKVSVEEAKKTVNLWYKERKEVLIWQQARKQEAEIDGCVHTLLGRARRFPQMQHMSRAQRGHIERAAINTPVQGSAADVAMCAMLEISKNKRLKDLGWRLLLQVHDEVILEGPTESAEVAKAIVVECMSKPFKGENILKVDLSVDAKCAQNWYEAK